MCFYSRPEERKDSKVLLSLQTKIIEMKKKALIILIITLISSPLLKGQNIQVFYDFGKAVDKVNFSTKPTIRSTFEMFKPDAWGSTFYFVDMDYAKDGVNSAYYEIARQLQFWEGPLAVQVEYNGGLNSSFKFNHNLLLGATYNFSNEDFSKTFSLSALYKYIPENALKHTFQLTGVWNMNFLNDLLSFSGYIDYWREDKGYASDIIMTQPQFWLNLNKINGINEGLNLSIGAEVDITHNFYSKGFFAIPAIGAKWSF